MKEKESKLYQNKKNGHLHISTYMKDSNDVYIINENGFISRMFNSIKNDEVLLSGSLIDCLKQMIKKSINRKDIFSLNGIKKFEVFRFEDKDLETFVKLFSSNDLDNYSKFIVGNYDIPFYVKINEFYYISSEGLLCQPNFIIYAKKIDELKTIEEVVYSDYLLEFETIKKHIYKE